MACDFWTAVCSRSLAPHLGERPLDALRYLSILYTAIRADEVAAAVIVAISELESSSGPQEQHHCVATLQERLLWTKDPVDQLIAGLAQTLRWGTREPCEAPAYIVRDQPRELAFVVLGAPALIDQASELQPGAS
jgi:hypothetical protein